MFSVKVFVALLFCISVLGLVNAQCCEDIRTIGGREYACWCGNEQKCLDPKPYCECEPGATIC
jgi:hypothetical protein